MAAREFFPTPRPQDGTLHFGIAPALPTAVTTRAVSAENSSAAASFDAAVRGSDMAAREMFPTPRPQHGTLHFSSAPAFSSAVATHGDSAGTYSTAASFETAVRGSETAARECFPVPRPQDGILEFSMAPTLPAAVATRDDFAGKCRAEKKNSTAVGKDDVFYSPPSTGDVPAPNTLDVSTRTNRDDGIAIAPPSGVDARSSSSRRARRMARHALITAGQVAEAQAATTVIAASSLHDPKYRRKLPPPAPVSSPVPMFFARPRLSISRTAKAREEPPSPARSTSGLRTCRSLPRREKGHPSSWALCLWRTPWTSSPLTQRTSGWLPRQTQGW